MSLVNDKGIATRFYLYCKLFRNSLDSKNVFSAMQNVPKFSISDLPETCELRVYLPTCIVGVNVTEIVQCKKGEKDFAV